MPHEIQKGNTATKPGAKKAPLGIPTWGWVAAIALGLVIGYLMIKNKGANAAGSSSTDSSGTNPLGSSGNSGGGAVASPPPDQTLNPITSTLNDPGTVSNPSGDSSTSTNPFVNPTSSPTNQFLNPGGEVQTLSPFAPVSGAPSAPGSDYILPGVQSHPGSYAPASGGYVPPNYAVLNPPTEPTNIHRPGFQI